MNFVFCYFFDTNKTAKRFFKKRGSEVYSIVKY